MSENRGGPRSGCGTAPTRRRAEDLAAPWKFHMIEARVVPGPRGPAALATEPLEKDALSGGGTYPLPFATQIDVAP
jgi:hypothetical protein